MSDCKCVGNYIVRRIVRWMLLFSLALSPGAAAWGGESTTQIEIKLYKMESTQLLYEGSREIITGDKTVTVRTQYRKPGGETIQREETVYEGGTLMLISHEVEDLRSGLHEMMTQSAGKVEIRFREGRKEDEEADQVQWVSNMASSMTIMPLLRRHWAEVKAGKDVEVEYLVPSRQEAITFVLRKESKTEVNGQPVTVVIMEPDSFIIRMLVDPLFFYLADAPPHRLLRYDGRVSLKTDQGDKQDLRVEYSFAGSK